MKRNSLRVLVSALLTLVMAPSTITAAAEPAPSAARQTGTVTGRVMNATTGHYLNNALVSVRGTNLVTFTNDFGEYRLPNVPAGTVGISVTYTGLESASSSLLLAGGATVTQDFSLERAVQGSVVTLDPFEVQAQREMNAREIALNEQRYADNIRMVVTADEFGSVSQDNAGELLKYLPGISIDQIGSEPSTVSVRGLPPDATPIMQDGNAVASAVSSQKVGGELMDSRAVGLEAISINNISRIEVTKSPTPDLRADAIGGMVNLVTRSAFERSKPSLNYRAYFNWNTDEDLFESSNAGPSRGAQTHTYPSFSFSYVNPVGKNFGYTLSGAHVGTYEPQVRSNAQFIPGVASATANDYTNPFLRSIVIVSQPKTTKRTSLGGSADWRIGSRGTLSVVANYNYFDSNLTQSQYSAGVTNTTNVPPSAWGPNFTQSQPTAAGVNTFVNASRQRGTTANLSAKYRHEGPIWKIDGGGYYSRASQHRRDIDEGFFRTTFFAIKNIGMRLEDFDSDTAMPKRITATNAAGQPIEWTRASIYTFGTASGGQAVESQDVQSQQGDSSDMKKGAHFNVRRFIDLPFLNSPVGLRFGGDIRIMDRDVRDTWRTWTFVGPDGLRTTADDLVGNYDIINESYFDAYEPPFGTARFQFPSTYKSYELFQSNPGYFRFDPVNSITRTVQASKKLIETVTAGYVRADFAFLRNRLKLVGGVRWERTGSEGEGFENNLANTFQKNPDGSFVLGSNGRPIKLAGTPAELAQLQFIDRGIQAKRNRDDFFPSVNATYALRQNLLVRAAYARTINRPAITNVVPGVTVSDPSVANVANLLINANNPDLDPWFADNYDLAFEYYFGHREASVLSVGGFYKEITDFFGFIREDATSEKLAAFGLDDTYLNYDIRYLQNAGDAKISGIDLGYRQALTFLPEWARGLEVFYNLTLQRLQGSTTADFTNFIRRTDNYGLSFSRPKYLLRLKVNDRGRTRQNQAQVTNGAPGAYRYLAPSWRLDVETEYRITPRLSIFASGRNVTKEYTNEGEIYGDGTPEWARPFQNWASGSNWECGVRGTF